MTTALDYFNLLFKPEILNSIRDHTNDYAIFKQDKTWRNRNNPDYVDSVRPKKNTVEELKTLFDMNILIDLILLP